MWSMVFWLSLVRVLFSQPYRITYSKILPPFNDFTVYENSQIKLLQLSELRTIQNLLLDVGQLYQMGLLMERSPSVRRRDAGRFDRR